MKRGRSGDRRERGRALPGQDDGDFRDGWILNAAMTGEKSANDRSPDALTLWVRATIHILVRTVCR